MCNILDTITHRVQKCTESKKTWKILENFVEKYLEVHIQGFGNLLEVLAFTKSEDKLNNVYQWIICGTIYFNLEKKRPEKEYRDFISYNRWSLIKDDQKMKNFDCCILKF